MRAKKINAADSAGPKCNPISANAGPQKVRKIIPIVPPIKEAILPVAKALPAFPFLDSGLPSRAVHIAEESPGIFNSVAEYAPPNMSP